MPNPPRIPFARRLLPAFCLALSFMPAARAADWPMFRGPDRNGISPDSKAPTTWGVDRNVKWQAALPQFVGAVDKNKGDVLWQTDEPGGAEDKDATGNWLGAWSTPVVAKVGGQEQVLMAMPRHVNAYDSRTGKVLWTCAGTGPLAY